MTIKTKFSTGTVSEKRVGYSRAVKVGNGKLYVSGTTSVDSEGNVIGKNVYEQSKNIFKVIEGVITEAGLKEQDVVMVRAYIVDMDQLPQFDKAFSEQFSSVNPTCTLVGINKLASPDLLIEIEVICDR